MTQERELGTRRQKLCKMTGKLWILLMKEAMDLPDDARMRGARYDPFNDLVEFVIESDEFPEVEEGAEPDSLQDYLSSVVKEMK